jgi:hypothetical protein
MHLMAFTSGTNMYYYSYLSNQWAYNIVDDQLKRERWLCNHLFLRFFKLHTKIMVGDYLGSKCLSKMKLFKFHILKIVIKKNVNLWL